MSLVDGIVVEGIVQTTENWPELDNWMDPHLFMVPDSFFSDH